MKKSVNTLFFVQLSLALMFIALGIVGITNYNNPGLLDQIGVSLNKLVGKNNSIVPILFAVLELVAGILLLVSLFSGMPGNFLSISLIMIFIFWVIHIVMKYFMSGVFEPNFFIWLSRVSPQLVILSALWLVVRENK